MEAEAYPSPEAVVSHLSKLKLTDSRRHSNGGEGGILEGEVDGQPERWFVKFGQDESKAQPLEDYHRVNDQLRAEFVALRLYHRLGINVPETHLVNLDGRLALVKKALPSLNERPNSSQLAGLEQVKHGFLVDVYLNNWDVTTNFGVMESEVYRFDAGGALDIRARGERKEFGPLTKKSIQDFRDPRVNYEGARVYQQVKLEDLMGIAKLIAGLENEEIAGIVKAAGYRKEQAVRITTALIRRREDIKKLFSIRKGERPKDPETEEDEEWTRLEEILPRNNRLDQIIVAIKALEDRVINPWSAAVVLFREKQSLLSQPQITTESLSDNQQSIDLVVGLNKELADLEKAVRAPVSADELKASEGRFGRLKLRLSADYRSMRAQKIYSQRRVVVEQKRSEISTAKDTGYAKAKSSLDDQLRISEQRLERLKMDTYRHPTNQEIPSPDTVVKAIDEVIKTRELLENLGDYCEKAGIDRTDKQREVYLRKVQDSITKQMTSLTSMWQLSLAQALDPVVGSFKALYQNMIYDNRFGYLGNAKGLAEFLIVPTSDQVKLVQDSATKVQALQAFLQEVGGSQVSNIKYIYISSIKTRYIC